MEWQYDSRPQPLDKGKPPKDIRDIGSSSRLNQLDPRTRGTIFFRPVDLGGSAKSEEHKSIVARDASQDADHNSSEWTSWLSSEAVTKAATTFLDQANPKMVVEAATTFMKAASKLNPKTVMRLMGLGATVLALTSQRVEAATIHGKNCSLDSTLHINNNNASLNILAERMERQFEKVFPTLVERFAKWDPCNPDRSDIWLNFVSLPNNDAGHAWSGNATINIDPEKIGGPNPDHGVPEGVETHELIHIVQNYTAPKEFLEGIAEFGRRKHAPKNDQPLSDNLELGSHVTEGYGVAAGFLDWAEQHVKLKEGLSTLELQNGTKVDFLLKSGTIVDVINGALKVGVSPDEIKGSLFEEITGRSYDEVWKEYFRSRFKIPTKTQTITQTEIQVIKPTEIQVIKPTETQVDCSPRKKGLYALTGAAPGAFIGLVAGAVGIIYYKRRLSMRQTPPQDTGTDNTGRGTTEQTPGERHSGEQARQQEIEMGTMSPD